MPELMNALEKIRIRNNLSRQQLADLAIPKTTQPQIYRLELWPDKGGRKFTMEWAERLATPLKIAPMALYEAVRESIKGNKDSIRVIHNSQNSDIPQSKVVPVSHSRPEQVNTDLGFIKREQPFTGVKDLPVFAAAAGGDGHEIIDTEPVDYVMRPPMLEHVREAYGLIIVLESMIPELWPNDTALINPKLPTTRDEVYVFYSADTGDGRRKATIKRLIGFNDKEWVVKQWNPEKKFKLPRTEWPVCHRYVGKYSA